MFGKRVIGVQHFENTPSLLWYIPEIPWNLNYNIIDS